EAAAELSLDPLGTVRVEPFSRRLDSEAGRRPASARAHVRGNPSRRRHALSRLRRPGRLAPAVRGEGIARLGMDRRRRADAGRFRSPRRARARRRNAQRRHDAGPADGFLARRGRRPGVMATWPDLTDYHEALQFPQRSLGDPELKKAQIAEGLLGDPAGLAALRARFRRLVKDIEGAKFAHGDLQHGNILVRGKDLLLIDYDGMWVPELKGRQATEIGHRAYQHPRRSTTDYGPYLDRFSALVIYLSLRALEIDRRLWDQYHTGDNLLFVREDFNEPGKTPIWGDLAALRHAEVSYLAGM